MFFVFECIFRALNVTASMDNRTQSAEVITYTAPERDWPYSFNGTLWSEPDIYNFQVRHPRCV